MRRILNLTLIALFLVTSLALAHHGPAKIVIDDAAAKQPAVPFDHAEHMKRVEKCETCHHTNKGLTAESDKDVKKCSSCHLDPKGDVPSMREMSMTKNPYHQLCVGCHKSEKKGPVVCKGCHVK